MRPRRVEIAEGVELWHADARDVIPELAGVGAVVTDPPYSSGGQFRADRAGLSTVDKYVQHGQRVTPPDFSGDNRDQRGYLAWLSLVLADAHRVSAPGSPIAVFTDWRQLPVTTDAIQAGGWIWRGIVPWDKGPASRPQRGRFRAQCEYLAWGSSGAMPLDRGVPVLDAVIRAGTVRESEHPAEKPVEVLARVVEIAAPGALVLDPFLGTGTTGIACVRTGRPFVGVELDAWSFELACERVRAAAAQGRLFA